MALSSSWSVYASAVVAASGTSVAPTSQPPDNCHTILVTNADAKNAAWIGAGAPGAALGLANATLVPAGGILTLALGQLSQRGPFSGSTAIRIDAAAAMTVGLTYLCAQGSSP